ncbi:hypothetical protein AVEN_107885-1, partial [Araneus ventricosus]
VPKGVMLKHRSMIACVASLVMGYGIIVLYNLCSKKIRIAALQFGVECPFRPGVRYTGRIFTNPTLIELRQEIGQYDWLASPRADDVVLCSRACTFH